MRRKIFLAICSLMVFAALTLSAGCGGGSSSTTSSSPSADQGTVSGSAN